MEDKTTTLALELNIDDYDFVLSAMSVSQILARDAKQVADIIERFEKGREALLQKSSGANTPAEPEKGEDETDAKPAE